MQEQQKKGTVTVDIQKRHSKIIDKNGNVLFEEEGNDREVQLNSAQALARLNSKR